MKSDIGKLFMDNSLARNGGEGGIASGVLPFALRAALRASKSLQAI